MKTQTFFFRECIERDFARRSVRNPRYSLRAFAKALQINPGALSQVLSGKRVPSPKMSHRFIDALNLSPDDRDRFLASVAETQRARGLLRISPVFKKSVSRDQGFSDLSLDQFHVIADWYHFSILELSLTANFHAEPQWISCELGIGITEASVALRRLQKLGLLVRKDGALRKSQANITTADKQITSSALKRRQKQILEKAIDSLENDPIETRSQSAMSMAIDPARLPVAKAMIQQFTERLCSFLESGEQKQVYELSVSLFPIQKQPPGGNYEN